MASPGSHALAAADPYRTLVDTASRVLRRIGLDIGPDDGGLVRDLIPFVIDPESLHTIPPLESVPAQYLQSVAGIRYHNVPLPPVPVLAPSLAHFLVFGERHLEAEFIDGQNVYGANVFGHGEGRRLLRRAVSCLCDELAAERADFDIIAYECDGFLIASPRRPGGPPLAQAVQRIIAVMSSDAVDAGARAVRDRLATFYRQAHGDVLAPATVSHQSRDDLSVLLAQRDIGTHGTTAQRFERLQALYRRLFPLIEAIGRRPLREQDIVLTLMEHRMYDPVLQGLADDLGRRGCRVRAFREPAELLACAADRPMTFVRLELVSLLKSINEHPLGGFLAGNEALRGIYSLLVTTLCQVLRDAGVDPAHELPTFRRWGDFYVGLDRQIADACDVCTTIDEAFARAKYVAIQRDGQPGATPYSASMLPTPPPPAASEIVVPLIPVVTADAQVCEDLLSMPIEQPGPHKLRAIEKRLSNPAVPGLDVAFLADWTLNACDANRGIPRLVGLLQATDEDIAGLARHYESYVNRKGKTHYRVRREARALQGVLITLRQLIARSRRR
jgi:hypothetical protein